MINITYSTRTLTRVTFDADLRYAAHEVVHELLSVLKRASLEYRSLHYGVTFAGDVVVIDDGHGDPWGFVITGENFHEDLKSFVESLRTVSEVERRDGGSNDQFDWQLSFTIEQELD